MADSVVGALRVDLGLNSAQFTKGLDEAGGSLGKFGAIAGTGLAAVVTAGVALTATLAAGGKAAIDHADALSKAAQKAGVTTEAMSQLEYAAKLSDVSLDGLTSTLGKLGKSMADAVVTPTSTAATAFKALGINVKDASGQLRPADAVLYDIADRFVSMPDGATKTALAMQVLGKSGAQMIPLLNGGSAALRELAAESDRTGNTVSTKTGHAAEDLNDTITRLGLAWGGLNMQIGTASIPLLQRLADRFTDIGTAIAGIDIPGLVQKLADGQNALQKFATNAGNSDFFKWLVEHTGGGADKNGLTPINHNDMLWGTFQQLQAQGQDPTLAAMLPGYRPPEKTFTPNLPDPEAGAASRAYEQVVAGAQHQVDALKAQTDALGMTDAAAAKLTTTQQLLAQASDAVAEHGKTLSDAQKQQIADLAEDTASQQQLLADLAHSKELSTNPFQTWQDGLARLREEMQKYPQYSKQLQTAISQTNLQMAASYLDMGASITGALSDLFKNNKAFAVSNAILQGLSGVANALGTGVPPWNLINAAAVGIEAAANVASILATNENSTSMPGTSAAASASAPAAAPTPSSAINLTVRGSGMISVDDFATQLAQQIADGGQQALVNVLRTA